MSYDSDQDALRESVQCGRLMDCARQIKTVQDAREAAAILKSLGPYDVNVLQIDRASDFNFLKDMGIRAER